MKRNTLILSVVLVGGLCLALAKSSTPVSASPATFASSATVVALAAGDDFEYVGSKSCKKCHIKVYKSWDDTSHAKAIDVLKAGEAADEKTKHGLDPAKDYTTDEKCLECHVVGHGKKGGYETPDPEDKKAVKAAKALSGVGCESCHGPGGGYMDLKKEIKKEKRKYKTEELTKLGMVVPTAETCQKCHTETHPTFDPEDKFDWDKMKEKGIHEHEELELREG